MIRKLLLEIGAVPIDKDPFLSPEVKAMLGPNTSRLHALLTLVYAAAMRAEPWAVTFVADRTEGRVAEAPAAANTDQRAQLLTKINEMVQEALPPPAVPTTYTMLDEGEVL